MYFGSLFAGVVCVLLSGVFPELTAVSYQVGSTVTFFCQFLYFFLERFYTFSVKSREAALNGTLAYKWNVNSYNMIIIVLYIHLINLLCLTDYGCPYSEKGRVLPSPQASSYICDGKMAYRF